ncbi:MAG: zinc ribbon domain-containing protein [Candidatus Gracilibacteria bacterium]
MEFPVCQSCGREMKEHIDFGAGDIKNIYCSNCTDEEGNLEAFEEVLRKYLEYILETETEDVQEALAKARATLPLQPAWHGEWKDVSDEEEGLEAEECRM